MTEIRYCLHCGAEFETDNKRRVYCSGTCKSRALYKRRTKKGLKAPSVSIEQMVDEMLRLSEEKGRSVQYGELQRMMLTGRHTIGGKRNG